MGLFSRGASDQGGIEKAEGSTTAPSQSLGARILAPFKSRKVQVITGIVIVAVIIIATAVPLTVGRHHSGSDSDSDSGSDSDSDSGNQNPKKPNIIFILTDDQDTRLNSLDYMPHLKKHMTDQGTLYPYHYCTVAICCPARAVIWTGRNAHNTNVTSLNPPYGGYPKFIQQGFNNAYLPVWLQEAGYQTYYSGKLLNGYSTENYDKPCPNGWNASEFLVDPKTYSYRTPATTKNCGKVKHWTGHYSTEILADTGFEFLDDATKSEQPFFLTIAPIAPHSRYNDRGAGPAVAAPKYAHKFKDVKVPRTENFNPDVPSGASWLRKLKKLDAEKVAHNDVVYRHRLQALQSVDELVDNLFQKLDEKGLLDSTYIFYTSDNGFHIGQHRLRSGKMLGYEEDVNVPLIVRGPKVPRGMTSNAVSAHVDLVPTFFNLAGIPQRDDFDGAPIPLSDKDDEFGNNTKLEHANIEFWSLHATTGQNVGVVNNTYKSVRLIGKDYNLYYSVWCTNEHELYDMTKDPGQMRNIFSDGFSSISAKSSKASTSLGVTDYELATRLDSLLYVLKSCRGDSCRQPWEALMPGSKVATLKDALHAKHHKFFSADVRRVRFDKCEDGYVVASEGPMFEQVNQDTATARRNASESKLAAFDSKGFLIQDEDWMTGNSQFAWDEADWDEITWEEDDLPEPEWSMLN